MDDALYITGDDDENQYNFIIVVGSFLSYCYDVGGVSVYILFLVGGGDVVVHDCSNGPLFRVELIYNTLMRHRLHSFILLVC